MNNNSLYSHLKKPINLILTHSYALSTQITKDNSSFYLGIAFSDKQRRNALYAIYAWMRATDDIVDNNNKDLSLRTTELNEFRHLTLQLINNEILMPEPLINSFWPAFCDTVYHFQIPTNYLMNMISCQQQDLQKYNYSTYEELYEYCKLAASTVGLIFITIMGYNGGKHSEKLAELCGIALQLTNILRDVQEDLKLKRVYLPAHLVGIPVLNFENFTSISHQKINKAVQQLINKANTYYQQSMNLHSQLHTGKLSFLILVNGYYALFKKICKDPNSIYSITKIKLTKVEKVKVLLNSLYLRVFIFK